jgi:hypothetical protein
MQRFLHSNAFWETWHPAARLTFCQAAEGWRPSAFNRRNYYNPARLEDLC